MRSGIAQIEGTKDVEISVEKRLVQLKYNATATSIQELMRAIQGKEGRFTARLAFELDPSRPSPEQLSRARTMLKSVKGFRSLSDPGQDGIALVTVDLEERTFLGDITAAANGVGLKLKPPKLKEANSSHFLSFSDARLKLFGAGRIL